MPDLIGTTVEDASRTYLLLRVAIVRDDHEVTSESDTTWRAEVADPASRSPGSTRSASRSRQRATRSPSSPGPRWRRANSRRSVSSRPTLPAFTSSSRPARRTTPDGSPPPSRTTPREGTTVTTLSEHRCRTSGASERSRDEPSSSWVRRARCAGRIGTFDDTSRSDEAVALCGVCSVRRDCRRWALANAVDGVAGGMTAEERAGWRAENGVAEPMLTLEDFLPVEVVSADRRWGRERSEAILRAVATWTTNGESGWQIASRLGVTRRTVSRLRTACRRADLLAVNPESAGR